MLAKVEVYEEPKKNYKVKDKEILGILRVLLEVDENLIDNIDKAKTLLERVSNKAKSLSVSLK